MRRPTSLGACLASTLLLVRHASSAPQLVFPINAQVPPVAYASRPYQFSFADTTFHSDSSSISYNIGSAPEWLSLDPNTRTLEGTPGTSDVGAVTFQVTASDNTGQTSASVTLVVADGSSLSTGVSITSSLRAAGQVQEPSTLYLNPLTSFAILFPPQLFAGTSSSTVYYAVTEDDSPLPPWIQFDAQVLRVSGSTPPIINASAQQQSYGVKLVASNVPGFAEAAVVFNIIVANRIFAFQSASETVNVTSGQEFQSDTFRDILYLDGKPISSADFLGAQASLPSWMKLDEESIILSGTVPEDFSAQTVTITAQDRSNDEATLAVTIQPASTGTPEVALNITAYPGEYLDYEIPESITDAADEVTASINTAAPWLVFSSDNLTFHGQVPNDLGQRVLSSSLTVVKGVSRTTYPVQILVGAAIGSTPTRPGPSSTGSSDIATSTPAGGNQADNSPRVNRRHILAIVLTTVFCVLGVVLIILLCLCWRKRKNKKQKDKEVSDDEQATSRNSAASSEFQATPYDGIDDAEPPAVVNKTSNRSSAREMLQTPVKPPQVELPWAPDSLKRARTRLQKRQKPQAHESFDSNWGDLMLTPAGQKGSPSLAAEPASADLLTLPVDEPSTSPKRKRNDGPALFQRKRVSREPAAAYPERTNSQATSLRSGLPSRLSAIVGVGHGSIIRSPSSLKSDNPFRISQAPTRSSWATTYGTLNGRDNARPSIATTNLDLFPLPPSTSAHGEGLPDDQSDDGLHGPYGSMAQRSDSKIANKPAKSRSVRAVHTPQDHPYNLPGPQDTEAFYQARKDWYNERARAELEGLSHFSNSGSRTPSISRFKPGTSAIRPSSRSFSPGYPFSSTRSGTFPIFEANEDGMMEGLSTPAGNIYMPSSPPSPSQRTREPPSSANWKRLMPASSSAAAFGPWGIRAAPSSDQPDYDTPLPQRQDPSRHELIRTVSISSGQFSSAVSSSSTSQWEDMEPRESLAVQRHMPTQMHTPPAVVTVPKRIPLRSLPQTTAASRMRPPSRRSPSAGRASSKARNSGRSSGYVHGYGGLGIGAGVDKEMDRGGKAGASIEEQTDKMLYELGMDERGERLRDTASSFGGNSAVASPRLGGWPPMPFSGGRETTGDEGETETGTGTESEGFVGRAVGRMLGRARASGGGFGGLRLGDNRKRVVSVDNKGDGPQSLRGNGDSSRPDSGGGSENELPWGGREKSHKGSLRFI
ncbi:uncharacterized protein HMPREF1541_05046 [Cyphellophora europaea CBS 101466]|uniref:Dystroglycan-type cadherin-like domain-containing protein n=1 Tax=Cyphellophora europaea (strain CBS 101466) TaxID=1220924 RepID=W2RW70_CYPE1|nr:uncharacterized protein HMPREF1541_05046 [Cyphellophora europaea CBS 101466]ETN40766.1 hypothetical protein HMPREF1541_05046 [Cyphellophora europaea CBS 101466]